VRKKSQKPPVIVVQDVPEGFFCIQNKHVFQPSTFPQFLDTIQNLLIVFTLNSGNLSPEQERILDVMQAVIKR
jgi:hypothetical protein